jgi:hypothetical protein
MELLVSRRWRGLPSDWRLIYLLPLWAYFKTLCALALLPLLSEETRQPQPMEQRWVTGMLLGLCSAVAVMVWQRAVFAGLLDFAGDYRVEGTFPELHAGGGDVHAYLVTAIPFVVAWIVLRPTAGRVALGAALFMLASYAIGVTFTRGGADRAVDRHLWRAA